MPRLFMLLLPLCVFTAACGRVPHQQVRGNQLKLIVLVVFDQLRGDYLSRWADQFGENGFRRICRDGAWFTNCHYPYACSTTGPGHASLSTGCSPNRHGIVGNEWYDRVLGKQIGCVASDRASTVYTVPRPVDDTPKASPQSSSPERMLAPSFADALKSETGGQARAVALSIKDRSACLPGGKNADACYWFDSRTGTFVTSTYYRDRAHDWVAKFNARKPADRWFGKAWDRLRPDLDYVRLAGPDDVFAESAGTDRKQGRVFPHLFTTTKNAPDKDYYGELVATPFGNDLLLDFAKSAIREMRFGQSGATDYLSVSFSSNDLVGHPYGPDSQEVLDVTLRSDSQLAELIELLDREVGVDQYVLALSADHGICPIPEIAASKGLDARRIPPEQIRATIDSCFHEQFGTGPLSQWVDAINLPWIHLNHRAIMSRGYKPEAVADALSAWLRRHSWVTAAFTRNQIEHGEATSSPYLSKTRLAYHPGRSGDLALLLKPYYLCSSDLTGTTHGSAHSYDTHVPLVLFGQGVAAGKYDEPITPQAVVAIFSKLAGITPPRFMDAAVPVRGLRPVLTK